MSVKIKKFFVTRDDLFNDSFKLGSIVGKRNTTVDAVNCALNWIHKK